MFLSFGFWIWNRDVVTGFVLAVLDTFYMMDVILMTYVAFQVLFLYSSNFIFLSYFLPRLKVISLGASLHLDKSELLLITFELIIGFISSQLTCLGVYLSILPKQGLRVRKI